MLQSYLYHFNYAIVNCFVFSMIVVIEDFYQKAIHFVDKTKKVVPRNHYVVLPRNHLNGRKYVGYKSNVLSKCPIHV